MGPSNGRAQAADPPADPAQKIVLFRIDSLGMAPELVQRLEAVLRIELERLLGRSLPSRPDVERAIAKDADLRGCTGEIGCLVGVGKKLGAGQIIAGNVGGLGENYVINLKLVDVATAQEKNRIRVPLEGNADALIEAVRVALVNLVFPERVRGSMAILVDVKGARVTLDGTYIGTTPLKNPVIANLDARPEEKEGKRLNLHTLRIQAEGYIDYIKPEIEVRFQKTTEVVVRLEERKVAVGPTGPLPPKHVKRRPYYTKWWFYTAVGAGALLTGAIIGWALSDSEVTDCEDNPSACGL